MISLDNISVAYGSFVLLDGVSFHISDGDKIGLVGKNGAGKSTLMKMICGLQNPTSGHIDKPSSVTIGYLPQIMEHHRGRSVLDEALTAFDDMLEAERRIETLSESLASRTDYESDSYMALVEEISSLTDSLSVRKSEPLEVQAARTLRGLGFKDEEFSRPTETFSQGWNMRIELAKILLRQPDVLLLDEPTNHLDLESIEWLEGYLHDCRSSILLVSHDRKFLDTVTRRTIEVMLGHIYDYKVPYSQYLILREERMAQQMAAYRNQQRMIEKTEDFIERFRYKPTKSNQVQSRVKALERLDRIEVDETDTSTMTVKFPPAPRSGDIVFKAEDLSAAYPERSVPGGAYPSGGVAARGLVEEKFPGLSVAEVPGGAYPSGSVAARGLMNGRGPASAGRDLPPEGYAPPGTGGHKVIFRHANIEIKRGEKVALVGRNGEGKTTLMRVIMRELDPYEGEARVGHNVRIGYYAQNQEDVLDKSETVFGTLDRLAVGDVRTKLRDILAAFLFKGEDIDKRVSVLSGGERARLGMAKLLLQEYNLLALDEPTNHMDIRSKDVLKRALKSFDGTLVVVSHDRDFLDGLVDKVYEFREGRVYEHLGSVQEFLEKRRMDSLRELERKDNQTSKAKSVQNDVPAQSKPYSEVRQASKQNRKVRERIAWLEREIEKLENQMKKIESVLSNPSEKDDIMDLTRTYLECKRDLDAKTEEWVSLGE